MRVCLRQSVYHELQCSDRAANFVNLNHIFCGDFDRKSLKIVLIDLTSHFAIAMSLIHTRKLLKNSNLQIMRSGH